MLTHLGTRELTTPRLTLRAYRPGDHAAMFANWASDPEVTRYLTWPTHASEAVSRNVIDMWIESYVSPTVYHWGITLAGELIGDIAAVNWKDSTACVEIGYCLCRRFWGQGIMTEALSAVIDFLFDRVGFYRITLMHDTRNPASGRVMQKCGLQYEGIHRGACRYPDGTWCDVARYAILRSDPRPWHIQAQSAMRG